MNRILKTASLALAASGLTLAAPAAAAPLPAQAAPQAHVMASDTVYEHGRGHHKHKKHKDRRYHGRHYDDRRYYDDGGYDDDRRYYRERPYYMRYDRNWGQPVYRNTRIWRGRDDRYYCEKDDGTTGLLVGAGVGALIGHEVAGRGGDRTLGAIIGGAAGALLGRSIDRSSTRCG